MSSAGARDRRIRLYRPRLVEGELSDEIAFDEVGEGWWASVSPLKDWERQAAGGLSAGVSHRFCVLWCADLAELDPTWELEFDGQRYGISGAKREGRNREIEISASAPGERVEVA